MRQTPDTYRQQNDRTTMPVRVVATPPVALPIPPPPPRPVGSYAGQPPLPGEHEADQSLWLVVGAIAIMLGAALALVTIPAWVPTLGRSLLGAEPKAYWYLSRASAIVSFVLLWVSMATGLTISNKMARVWPGAFTAFDLHQYTSLLGLAFGVVHALLLLATTYITYNLAQVIVPFSNPDYRPLWVGLGQVALYLCIVVTFTFYIRKHIGNRTWHIIHYFSYAVFALALLHGLLSGTDSGNVWISWMYWLAGASLLALTVQRFVGGVASTTA